MKRVLKSELKSEFQTLEPVLQKYLDEFPEYDMHEMLRDILMGKSILWLGENSFAMGGPLEYHNARTFLMECTAGDVEEIMEAMPIIEADIKAWGFNEIEVCGRYGWKKKMQPYGFELDRVILKKTIGEV